MPYYKSIYCFLCIIFAMIPATAPAQLNMLKKTMNHPYREVEDCIGPMGVAKMQALEIKLQRTINELEMKCMLNKNEAKRFAEARSAELRSDPTVFELEKCSLELADDYIARVNTLTDPLCP